MMVLCFTWGVGAVIDSSIRLVLLLLRPGPTGGFFMGEEPLRFDGGRAGDAFDDNPSSFLAGDEPLMPGDSPRFIAGDSRLGAGEGALACVACGVGALGDSFATGLG